MMIAALCAGSPTNSCPIRDRSEGGEHLPDGVSQERTAAERHSECPDLFGDDLVPGPGGRPQDLAVTSRDLLRGLGDVAFGNVQVVALVRFPGDDVRVGV